MPRILTHVMTRLLRKVTFVEEQPSKRNSKDMLFAFGYKAIAEITGQSPKTVQRHANDGGFDPSILASVVYYIQVQCRHTGGVMAGKAALTAMHGLPHPGLTLKSTLTT